MKRKLTNSLLQKLKGYNKAPKERFLALHRGIITQEELLMYELGIAITDWDTEHLTYGTFCTTNREIAEILGWKSDTSALRVKAGLIKKGLFIETEDGRIKVKGFDKWLLRKSSSEIKPLSLKIETFPSNNEREALNKKEVPTQNNDYSLSSFKDNLGLFKETLNESLTDEELNRILFDIDSQKQRLEGDKK